MSAETYRKIKATLLIAMLADAELQHAQRDLRYNAGGSSQSGGLSHNAGGLGVHSGVRIRVAKVGEPTTQERLQLHRRYSDALTPKLAFRAQDHMLPTQTEDGQATPFRHVQQQADIAIKDVTFLAEHVIEPQMIQVTSRPIIRVGDFLNLGALDTWVDGIVCDLFDRARAQPLLHQADLDYATLGKGSVSKTSAGRAIPRRADDTAPDLAQLYWLRNRLEKAHNFSREDAELFIQDVRIQGHPPMQGKVARSVWTVKMAIAFWAAIHFVCGATLFVTGSFTMYPGVCPNAEYATRWVDYPIMVGSWCFTLAHYLVYFQAINRMSSHSTEYPTEEEATGSPTRWLIPRRAELSSIGYWGALCNLIAISLYVINSMGMYGHYENTVTGYNWGYVMTGSVGSALYGLGAVLEGEYNDWRRLSRNTSRPWPKLAAYFSLAGSILFFQGFIADYNKWVTGARPDLMRFRMRWFVATPFTVGSFFFLESAWLTQIMWKKHMYGLGFAKELSNNVTNQIVSLSKQAMVVVYSLNLCSSYVNLGLIFGKDATKSYGTLRDKLSLIWSYLFRVVVYNGILVWSNLAHDESSPDDPQYRFLYHATRAGAILDLLGQILLTTEDNPLLFSR